MSYLTRNLSQTSVYWGNPRPDSGGGDIKAFDDGVEISSRWEIKKVLFKDVNGEERQSNAVVFVDRDVDIGGFLYLGDLDDLPSGTIDDPFDSTVSADSQEILGFDKIPNLRATKFERIAYV